MINTFLNTTKKLIMKKNIKKSWYTAEKVIIKPAELKSLKGGTQLVKACGPAESFQEGRG